MKLGAHFEAEIREQPAVWRRLAQSGRAQRLAQGLHGRDAVLLGSGSSLFMAQLGALALRRRGVRAHALAAGEAPFDHAVYQHAVVVAISQSGESADMLAALDVLAPAELIALTNTPASTLAARASLVIDVGAGPETAVPASKSVTATAAILLWAAHLIGGVTQRSSQSLTEAADAAEAWLGGAGYVAAQAAAQRLARRRSVVVLASGYGVPIASECALKFKEASYLHAEGFSAGEFRHGSAALIDASCAMIGFVDDASRPSVERAFHEAADSEALCYTIGDAIDAVPALGPQLAPPFNTLGWLLCAQVLALFAGRLRSIESDLPRGLHKSLR